MVGEKRTGAYAGARGKLPNAGGFNNPLASPPPTKKAVPPSLYSQHTDDSGSSEGEYEEDSDSGSPPPVPSQSRPTVAGKAPVHAAPAPVARNVPNPDAAFTLPGHRAEKAPVTLPPATPKRPRESRVPEVSVTVREATPFDEKVDALILFYAHEQPENVPKILPSDVLAEIGRLRAVISAVGDISKFPQLAKADTPPRETEKALVRLRFFKLAQSFIDSHPFDMPAPRDDAEQLVVNAAIAVGGVAFRLIMGHRFDLPPTWACRDMAMFPGAMDVLATFRDVVEELIRKK